MAFPIVMWLLATMLVRGDLGRWNDDYAFVQGIPGSAESPRWHPDMSGVFTLKQQFWRPLFFVIVPALQTALYDHPWINHALHALAYAGLGALVWVLLRDFGVSRWSSAAVALLYLTLPVNFQAALWSSCLTTVLATELYILLALMYRRYAELPAGSARGTIVRAGAWIAGMTAVGVLIPLINEQPAAAVVALPWLHPALGLGRRLTPDRTGRPSFSLSRALTPVLVLLALDAVYLWAYVTTSRPGYPATSGTFIHADEIATRWTTFLPEMWRCLTLDSKWDTLFWRGAAAARDLGGESWAWVAAVVIASVFWIRYWAWSAQPAHPRESVDPATAWRTPTALQVGAFSITAIAAAWGVIYMLSVYQPQPRLFLMPLVPAALIVARVIDRVARARVFRSRWAVLTASAAVALQSLNGALILAGAQDMFRQTFHRDESYGQQLRALLPQLPPNSYLLPTRIEDPRYEYAENFLGLQFHQIFLSSYNVNAWVKQQLRDPTATAGTYTRARHEFKAIDSTGLGSVWWFVPTGCGREDGSPDYSGPLWRVPWDRVIPFEIDCDGRVALVTRVVVQRADNRDDDIDLPHVRAAAFHPPAPRVAVYYNREADLEVSDLAGWAWPDGSAAAFVYPREWQLNYKCVELTASESGGTDRSSVTTDVPPDTGWRRVCFRACLSAATTDHLLRSGGSVRVEWFTEDRAAPIAHLTLDAGGMLEQQRWVPVTFRLPPSTVSTRLAVRVRAPAGSWGTPVLVTHGFLSPGRSPARPPSVSGLGP